MGAAKAEAEVAKAEAEAMMAKVETLGMQLAESESAAAALAAAQAQGASVEATRAELAQQAEGLQRAALRTSELNAELTEEISGCRQLAAEQAMNVKRLEQQVRTLRNELHIEGREGHQAAAHCRQSVAELVGVQKALEASVLALDAAAIQ